MKRIVNKNEGKEMFAMVNSKALQSKEEMDKIGTIGFSVYCVICNNRTFNSNMSYISIEDTMKQTNDIKSLNIKMKEYKKALIDLKENGYIDFDVDINKANKSTFIKIEIKEMNIKNKMFKNKNEETDSFIKFYESDYQILLKLGIKKFIIHMILRSFYNEKKGYSYPSLKRLSDISGFSTSTVRTMISELKLLDIYDVEIQSYTDTGRTNNIYRLNFDGIQILLDSEKNYDDMKKEIKSLKASKIPKENENGESCDKKSVTIPKKKTEANINDNKKNVKSRYTVKTALRRRIEFEKIRAIVYKIECWNSDEKFYKIGITSFLTTKKRFDIFGIPYKYRVVDEIHTNLYDAILLENKLHEKNKEFLYVPNKKFSGYTECFSKIENMYNDEVVTELDVESEGA